MNLVWKTPFTRPANCPQHEKGEAIKQHTIRCKFTSDPSFLLNYIANRPLDGAENNIEK